MHKLQSAVVAAALLFPAACLAEDRPVFNSPLLSIPRVDAPDQVGNYQDVTFQLTPQGAWVLTGVQVLGTPSLQKLAVTSVEMIMSNTFPVSVYLRASGTVPDCLFQGPGRVQQRLVGTRFDVTISAKHATLSGPGLPNCPGGGTNFRLTIPLDVYGLSAGTYAFNVNGFTGAFSLASDNKFPGECDVAAATAC